MVKKYKIQIVRSAELDLEQIYHYVFFNDSPAKADYVLDKLYETVHTLDHMPHRGVHPPELYEIGMITHRQIHFKPYRIIYSVDDENYQVFIEIIVDGRRNIQPVLAERFSDDDSL